jgi:hypothetical protein
VIFSHVLYQLSYLATRKIALGREPIITRSFEEAKTPETWVLKPSLASKEPCW